MANVFNRITPEYRVSVHTPDFDPADWAINPDVALAAGQPVRYWFLTGATNPTTGAEIVDLVDAATRAAIDQAIADANTAADKAGNKVRFDVERVLPALAVVIKDEVNLLRAQHGLAARTNAQIRTAVRDAIDAAP